MNRKKNSKIVYLKLIALMIILSVNGLTTPMKSQDLLNRIKDHNPVTSCQQEALFKNADGLTVREW